MPKPVKFGNQIPHCEPKHLQGFFSPYYTEKHLAFRRKVREFVEKELRPHNERWIKEGYPVNELHRKAYQAGISGVIYPKEYGGTPLDGHDAFFEVVLADELARLGGGGVLAQLAINSMALPPVLLAGTEEMKRRVVTPTVRGDKTTCLALSEPTAGSDVAGFRTTAHRQPDGSYLVNGSKKWISGGATGDFFVTAVRVAEAGEKPSGGLTLLLLERGMPGFKIRKMEVQFDNASSTTFLTFDNVRVPKENLIGEEDEGFRLILTNFNHERAVIASGTCRAARMCYQQAFEYAMKRKTFGKTMVQHPVIRAKLGEMARQIEMLQDQLDSVAYQYSCGIPDYRMAGPCALLKVNASRIFEFCAREASQVFGGSAIVKEGQGKLVERLYREVRASAIPGGSEEVLIDLAVRQAVAKAKKVRSKM